MSTQDERLPVVMIHGFLATKEMMFPLKHNLSQRGFDVFNTTIPPFALGDMASMARELKMNVDRILEETQSPRCDLLGVSVGGLIALYYIKRLGGNHHVRRFVALGTPFQGTWKTLWGIPALGLISPCLWQVVPNSTFLRDLAQGDLPEEVEILSLAARHDPIAPPARALLDGAHNIEVPDIPFLFNHQYLIFSPTILRLLTALLAGEKKNNESRAN